MRRDTHTTQSYILDYPESEFYRSLDYCTDNLNCTPNVANEKYTNNLIIDHIFLEKAEMVI